MRTDKTNSALLRTVSTDRLKKYLKSSDGDSAKALDIYEYNASLSEAFYKPLQCCEIALRNCIHETMTAKYGVRWFEDSAIPFTPESESQILSALEELKKAHGEEEVSSGSVVAELKFAFWVGLLGPKYDNTLWRLCLHKVFQSGAGRTRKQVHGRFNAIRRFRNRVFHHEPIYHIDVQRYHDEIIEGIRWMCPATADWALSRSRVDEVLASAANTPSTP